MKSMSRVNKSEIWRKRLEMAARRTGTLSEFCRSEGVSLEALRYWQKKFAQPCLPAPTASFVAVEIEEASRGGSLPDPRWLAELILHLQGGRR